MSRIIGLGLSLLKNDHLEDDSLSRDFIIQDFSYDKFVEQERKENADIKKIEERKDIEERNVNNLMDSLDKLNNENTKIKLELKTKIEF